MRQENTPMMRQFYEFKDKHPDALLLFRCGDFYETYADDAVVAARILGITLTHRSNKGKVGQIEMAGFPHHALDTYLPRLVRAGHRVAICDQLEDPKLAKKLVKRGITELVTPGIVLGDSALTSRENNFLAALHYGKAALGISFLDISTGEFLVAEGTAEYADKLLTGFQPKEILILRGQKQRTEELFGTKNFIYEMEDWAFSELSASGKIRDHFGVKTLKGFGIEHLKAGIVAAGAILNYLEVTGHTQTSHITRIARIEEDRYVRLDRFTVRNLELVHSMAEDGRSLLNVIDHTLTPMGARQLHRWVLFPLRNVAEIQRRQDGVEQFFRAPDLCDVCEEELQRIGDMERIISKTAVGRVSPRELDQMRIALECVGRLKAVCEESNSETLLGLARILDPAPELHDRLLATLYPDPPATLAKGGVIAHGVNKELDELREIHSSGKAFLQRIQEREAEATGIQSLKIGYNNVFGYYIEVRNTYKNLVPQEWIRKQTLVQAERYITPELKEYEEKILGAEDRILALEAQLFSELTAFAMQYIPTLQATAAALSNIDCLYSLAIAARTGRYVRPVIDDSLVLDIRQGRHAVIETLMPPGEEYVPNDVRLDNEDQQIVIVTGPNMAGKSALLRQTALITLLAQMGSFVPAESARVGVVDKIFTRVGASDNISMGESTFMVEMSEAANIMNNLSARSLVLFDELGRGTSTYDGISIAWAIVEYLHENERSKARTLFATHYHELNEMERMFPRIKNWNVSVREVNQRIVFLRKLQPGGSEHSFGIHVARLAGMPHSIVSRAEDILKELEASGEHSSENLKLAKAVSHDKQEGTQLSFFQLDDPILEQIRDEILSLDVNNLTPLDALNKLNAIKRILQGK